MAQLNTRSARMKFIPLDHDPEEIGGGEAQVLRAIAPEPRAAAARGDQPQAIAGAASRVFINEFHYDNASGDVGERIEIVAPEGTDVSGYSLVRYNGSVPGAAVTYGSTNLSSITPTTVNGVSYFVIIFPVDGLQNGTADGFALVNNGTVIQLLSYEGVFTAATGATGGPAAGQTSTDVGVSESGTTPVGFSLQLTGTGDNYGDFTWRTEADDNFGSANIDQTINFGAPPPPPPPPPPPGPGAFSVSDATVVEGNSGSTPITFTVTRDSSAGAATVDYSVGAGSTNDADFVPGQTFTGTLSFADGVSSGTVTFNVAGDTVFETNETFALTLANATGGATIRDDFGLGTITNDDSNVTRISAIQGAQHSSPLLGSRVVTTGVVTAVDSNGFYLQDPNPDADIRTSEAIFVFTSSAPTVQVGQNITLDGTVAEFFPGGAATGNLSTTQLTSPSNIVLNASNVTLPAAIILGPGGRLPPTENIEDDNFGSFDPATDGIDFYESLEGMLVHVPGGTVVAPTTDNGEIFVVTRNVAGELHATNLSSRGTLNIDGATGGQVGTTNQGPGSDFNPERIQIDGDSTLTPGAIPDVDVGAVLNGVTGVITYNFGNFEIAPTSGVTVASASTLPREVTTLVGTADRLSVASYNVENLDPSDTRFATLAQQIETNLGTPDIIGLQEIQDNDGPGNAANSTVVSASVTLQKLVDAIFAETGIQYAFIDNPFIADDKNGGEPGGNIRNAFLYRTDRVSLVEGSVTTTLSPEQLAAQRTDASSPFFASRIPLVATFTFRGEDVTVIDNHFASKGGSTPLFGTVQPSTNSDEAQRQSQAQNVADYVASLGSGRDIVVLGDLNEFETEEALIPLSMTGGLTDLINILPEEERYSFIFDGNSQQLDHLYVSQNLVAGALIDIVHVNTEFTDRPTDHDPSVATLALTAGGASFNSADTFNGTSGNDTARGDGGDDFFFLQQGGNDTGRGGSGNDSFYFGAALTSADVVDGGAGTNDQIGLQGDYTGARAVTLGNVTNIEVIVPLPGNDMRFGDTSGASYSYTITTTDVNVAGGATLVVDAARLRVGENVIFNGSAETNGSFFVYAGVGVDSYRGGAGDDLFLFRQPGGFTSADSVDGGAGTGDQLGLRGDYTGANAVILGATSLVNTEALVFLSGQDTRFNSLAFGDFSYDVTSNEATVAAGAQLVVDAGALSERESLRFDGSAETNGTFRLFGGGGNDILTGGQGADLIRGNLGADRMDGRGGADIFQYRDVAESTASRQDVIDGFASGEDRVDLSMIDANSNADGNNDFAFIGSNMFSGAAGELRAVNMGNMRFTVEGDVNGDRIADFVLTVNMSGAQPLTMTDFIV